MRRGGSWYNTVSPFAAAPDGRGMNGTEENGMGMMKSRRGRVLCLFAVFLVCCFPAPSSASPESYIEEVLLGQLGAGHLPVIRLSVDPEEGARVNESEDHSYRARGGSLRILVPDGYTGDSGERAPEDTGDLEIDYIRGRGHGTWAADKKPYRIKLKDGADLLGMGKNKHWVLLANRYDPSLLRNRLISFLGAEFGLPFTPECLPVDLVVNGEYYGSYLLCEQVRIGKNRVAVDELTENDVTFPEITGGYLLFLNPLWDEPAENVFVTDRLVRFGVDSPGFTSEDAGQPAQRDYIAGFVQDTENAVFSPDFMNGGRPYSEYMDIGSAARYWWIQEYSVNFDGMRTSSTYLYKERGGRLRWGPLWDFDLALGAGDGGTEGFEHCGMPWLDHLRAFDEEYGRTLTECWGELDALLGLVLEEGGVLDTFASEIRASWEADSFRWGRPEGGAAGFDETVGDLRRWMSARRKWISENIARELTHVYDTVTLMSDGREIGAVSVPRGKWPDPVPMGPVRDGLVFIGWERDDRTPYEAGDMIDGDTRLHAVYIPEEDAVKAEKIFFPEYHVYLDIRQKRDSCVYVLVPENAEERTVAWTSSDPETAEVDEYGGLLLKKTGEVKITGTLRNGNENSFVLHIYDSLVTPLCEPERIEVSTPALTLSPGEYGQVIAQILPEPNGAVPAFSSDDPSVAEIDYYGVVRAISPGTATLRVYAAGNETVPEAEVTVTVK